MKNSLNLKNKLVVLILLTSALGMISLFPNNKTGDNKLTDKSNLQENNIGSKTSINCDDYKSDLSMISENQKENNSPDSCLFIGCSGFNF